MVRKSGPYEDYDFVFRPRPWFRGPRESASRFSAGAVGVLKNWSTRLGVAVIPRWGWGCYHAWHCGGWGLFFDGHVGEELEQMTLDLPGGRRLVLAGGGYGWFWLATGLAALVLLLVLYREERRLVSRRAGLGLLGLRLLAAGALVSALFEPIAARTFRETIRGRVVVGVDVSESMATADAGRNGEERSKLLKVLGMSPADPIDTTPRREVARRLLVGEKGPIARLGEEHAVEAFAFARDTAEGSVGAIAEGLKRPGKGDDPSALATDWEPVLLEALKTAADAAPVLGVVLLTDGRRNAPGDVGPTVDRLAARGVPVFPVQVGSSKPPRDAAIAGVKAPELVYKGDVASIEATIKLDGYAGREVAVTLERPGASPLRQTVRGTSDGSRPTLTFRVPMEDQGAAPLSLAVGPMEGDVRPDNDRRALTVQVADDKARVLLVDGEARWEFRYLRNALGRDARVAVESVVFHQPLPGLSAEPSFSYGTELPKMKGGESDPLSGFDVVILGDVDPGDLAGEAWGRLEKFVAERGGTLVMLPGPRYWGSLGANEISRRLLPLVDPQPVNVDARGEDPAHPELPPGVAFEPSEEVIRDAGAWPMLQLAAEPEESKRRWAGLPRLPWVLAGKAKPGATALATAGGGGDASMVLMAAQPYGLGKVIFVGTDGTWRWRHRVGDAYHHRFWGQVVRWGAAGKLGGGNALVRFGPLKPRSAEGEAVKIQARISEGVVGLDANVLIAARVYKAGPNPGEAAAVIPLRASAGQSRLFEGKAPGLPIGSYVIRLDAPGLSEALQLEPPSPAPRPEATLEIAPRDGSERVELAAARDPLERLATATGGKALYDYEADELPGLLRALKKERVRTEETPLWDTPAALLLFFGIVTVEWVARKRVGLP